MRDLGYGEGYVYAHDTEEGVGGLDCLPDGLRGRRFYRPRESGEEKEMARRLGMKGWCMGHATDIWGQAQIISRTAFWEVTDQI